MSTSSWTVIILLLVVTPLLSWLGAELCVWWEQRER